MIDLKTVLREHPGCLTSRARFKSVLLDLYPGEKRAVNVLTSLYESGAAEKIKGKTALDEGAVRRLTGQMELEYGIAPRYAREAVLTWAAAYDVQAAVDVNAPDPQQTAPEPPVNVLPPPQDKPAPSKSAKHMYKGYEIRKRPNGYNLTDFTGTYREEMKIPGMFHGKPITEICWGTFLSYSDEFDGPVKRIYICEGIEIIGFGTFEDFTSLVSVELPATLKNIGMWAFKECSRLQHAVLPQGLESIGEGAFHHCKSLRKIRIPDSVTKIGRHAFADCGLKAVYIPPAVTSIEGGAFDGNADLTIYCAAGTAARNYAKKNGCYYSGLSFLMSWF